jgi:hypothetical protein
MSWGAQNRSKDAKNPSVGRGMSDKPELDRCPVQAYINGLLCRVIKNLGASQGQAAPALTFCIPKNSNSTDDTGAIWSHTLERKEGDYVVASAVSNGLTYLRVQGPRGRHLRAPPAAALHLPRKGALDIPGGRRLCNELRRRRHVHAGHFRVRHLRSR